AVPPSAGTPETPPGRPATPPGRPATPPGRPETPPRTRKSPPACRRPRAPVDSAHASTPARSHSAELQAPPPALVASRGRPTSANRRVRNGLARSRLNGRARPVARHVARPGTSADLGATPRPP